MVKSVTVFAPATIANLGPGFDVLGIALQEPGDTVTATKTPDHGVTITEITGVAINIPKEAIVGLVGGLFVLLFLVHVVLQVIIIVKWVQYERHNSLVKTMASDKEMVDSVLDELRTLKNKKQSPVISEKLSYKYP